MGSVCSSPELAVLEAPKQFLLLSENCSLLSSSHLLYYLLYSNWLQRSNILKFNQPQGNQVGLMQAVSPSDNKPAFAAVECLYDSTANYPAKDSRMLAFYCDGKLIHCQLHTASSNNSSKLAELPAIDGCFIFLSVENAGKAANSFISLLRPLLRSLEVKKNSKIPFIIVGMECLMSSESSNNTANTLSLELGQQLCNDNDGYLYLNVNMTNLARLDECFFGMMQAIEKQKLPIEEAAVQ
jgi:hypothetical protein